MLKQRKKSYKKPLISVIVPSYNHEKYILSTLESIRKQSYRPLEVVIIDDGSSDKSTQVISKYLKSITSNNIKWVFKARENRGATYTINEAILMSKGKFVTILNSDDLYLPKRLELLLLKMQKENSEIGLTGVEFIDSKGREIPKTAPIRITYENVLLAVNFHPSVSLACFSFPLQITSGNLLFSKKIYDQIGGFKDFFWCHDYDFLLRACLVSEPVFLSDKLIKYRKHDSNTIDSIETRYEEYCLEYRTVLRNSISTVLCENSKPKNPYAPTPANWPGVFPTYLNCGQFWFSKILSYTDGLGLELQNIVKLKKGIAIICQGIQPNLATGKLELFLKMFQHFSWLNGISTHRFEMFSDFSVADNAKIEIFDAKGSNGQSFGNFVSVSTNPSTLKKYNFMALIFESQIFCVLGKQSLDGKEIFIGFYEKPIKKSVIQNWELVGFEIFGSQIRLSKSRNKSKKKVKVAFEKKFHGNIDGIIFDRNNRLVVSGWCLEGNEVPDNLEISVNNRPVKAAAKLEERADLKYYLANYTHLSVAGFKFSINANLNLLKKSPKPLRIAILSQGKEILVKKLGLR